MDKNSILASYSASLLGMVSAFNSMVASLVPDDEEFNKALIKTLNIQLEAVRSQTVIIQSALDTYSK